MTDWKAVKAKTVETAVLQHDARWQNPERLESEGSQRPILLEYYSVGVGMSDDDIIHEWLGEHPNQNGRPRPELLTSFFSSNAHPWSAVFISFVMRSSGAGEVFRGRLAHTQYVKDAKARRISEETAKPIWAYAADERAIAVGDIIVKARGQAASFDDFEGKISHGDIVVSIAGGHAVGIGGNVRNSVRKTNYELQVNGLLKLSGDDTVDPFAIVRIEDAF